MPIIGLRFIVWFSVIFFGLVFLFTGAGAILQTNPLAFFALLAGLGFVGWFFWKRRFR